MEASALIILAAGQGKRMKSSFPKVIHLIAGKPMLAYSLRLGDSLGIKKKMVVVGHEAERIKAEISNTKEDITYVYQDKQLGTAHAVEQVRPHLKNFSGNVLVLSADVPLLRESTIQKMIHYHVNHRASCTLLTAKVDQPAGYGRIIRNQKGQISEIVEQSDLKKGQEQIKEINAGIYCFRAKELFNALLAVNNYNRQREYYLTDVISILMEKGYTVGNLFVEDSQEIAGVNTRVDLSYVSRVIFQRNAEYHMSNGVTVIDPKSTFIENLVQIGQDTIVYPFTIITSGTKIGKLCHIGPYSHIINTSIGCRTKIYSSIVEESQIGNETMVGPYAHIRPGSVIGDKVRIGNYVEVKKTVIGNESKVGHLTYLGDATLGRGVNIGAGTITCNYDGKKKNTTIIEDGVFIGSNNSLVAPVTIGRNSYTAAGSTITQNISEKSLGIARARQKNIAGWVDKRSKKENE